MKPCPKYQEKLALLAAGVLEETEHGPLLAHTTNCPACRRYLAELSEICHEHAAVVDGLPALETSIGFRRELAERIHLEDSMTWAPSLAEWLARALSLRWRIAFSFAGVVLALVVLASRNTTEPLRVPGNDPSAKTVATTKPNPSTQFWLTYQTAANQSFETLDALLARDAALSAPGGIRVTAGMRELSGLTE